MPKGMSTEKSGFGRQFSCQITGKRRKKALPAICGQCFEKQGEELQMMAAAGSLERGFQGACDQFCHTLVGVAGATGVQLDTPVIQCGLGLGRDLIADQAGDQLIGQEAGQNIGGLAGNGDLLRALNDTLDKLAAIPNGKNSKQVPPHILSR